MALVCALAGSAHASDLLTVNTTNAYVDPAVTGEFITVPNLCLEPYGDQATTTGCDELGARAVQAYQGLSPYGDIYFEPLGISLSSENAFVPGNSGSAVNDTGFAPIFSDHKYDLFGRAEDRMGPLARREIFLLELINLDGGITTGQNVPGSPAAIDVVIRALIAPEGATSFIQTGETFQIADLPVYLQSTGFTSGKLTTITNFCNALTGGSPICAIPEFAGLIYVSENFPKLLPNTCTSADDPIPSLANCNARDAWMDQVVVGYVEAWESLGGDDHFAQNFRSQVGYDDTATLLAPNTEVWTDFRLEQSVELSGAFTTRASDPGDAITPGDNLDGIAGRQTFQQAIATESLASLGFLRGGGDTIGQMVAQDVNGYLMTCMNCDTAGNGGGHAFAPDPENLTFMPYQAGWQVVPTVVHAGQ